LRRIKITNTDLHLKLINILLKDFHLKERPEVKSVERWTCMKAAEAPW
jgi:hypothetical protein